jgi:hypothetical protein
VTETKRLLRAGAAAVVFALIVAGCGGTGKELPAVGSTQTAAAAIRNAADLSSVAKGSKSEFSEQIKVRGTVELALHGTAAVTAATKASDARLVMAGPRLGTVNGVPLTEINVGPYQYLTVAPKARAQFDGKPWARLQLTKLSGSAGLSDLGTLSEAEQSEASPTRYFGFLRAVSGNARYLGRAQVNGAETKQYSADLVFSKLPSALPAYARRAVQQLSSELSAAGISSIPFEVWVDSAGLVRRVIERFSYGPLTERVEGNFLDYGAQPKPQVPPASETYPVTTAAQFKALF